MTTTPQEKEKHVSISSSSQERITLEEIATCFEGTVPSVICTCSANGAPNVTTLSIVHRIDESHVALTFQFFSKTKANIAENPKAQAIVSEPRTAMQYRLDLLYERTETHGPLFDRVRTQLDAIASQTGMSSCFMLRGVDVYRVLSVRRVPSEVDAVVPLTPKVNLDGLEAFSRCVANASSLDALLNAALESLASMFGWEHSFILAIDERAETLYTLASHGFETSGIGSEVRFGEGVIGAAARERRTIRITHMGRQLIYARAVRATIEAANPTTSGSLLSREIPLPGLASAQSQLIVPLIAAGQLIGLLCLQSTTIARFQAADERLVGIAAPLLASAMSALSADEPDIDENKKRAPKTNEREATSPARVRYFAADDSIFVDDEYLIKGVAGRVLWRLLEIHRDTGREEFTNKEIRVEPGINLPALRDNLEARLILLRKRLEEHCTFIRLVPSGRGRFQLAVTRRLVLESVS